MHHNIQTLVIEMFKVYNNLSEIIFRGLFVRQEKTIYITFTEIRRFK